MQSNRTIYLIDDDEIYTYTTKKVLQRGVCKHEVQVYGDGIDALEALKNDAVNGTFPDIIFLDIDMPALDGWEFLDEIAQENLDTVPVIYVSSSTIDPAEIERAESNDLVQEFIAKPVSKEKLEEICWFLDEKYGDK